MLLALLIAAIDLAQAFSNSSAWEREIGDYAHIRTRGMVTYSGIDVWEARFVEDGGRIERVEMILYNRGDDKSGGRMSVAELKALLERAVPGIDVSKAGKVKLKSGAFRYEWSDKKRTPPLEATWGVEDGAVQYVRLVMKGPRASGAGQRGSGSGARGIAKSVRKESNGDVWIDGVPMVDQGDKGYCAVATGERVLRYYGKNVDEHELAQMAETSADGGTSVRQMIETVRKTGSRYRLGYNEIVSMQSSRRDIEKEVENYNKSAKAMRRPELDISRFMLGNTLLIPMLKAAMEPEVLLRERTKDARFKKFAAGVKNRIDQGIPVFWGVTLGIFPEPDIPQASGGHMRLIIGYNAKTHEILYSDSWGKGHELKRMREDVAFAITHDAFSLKPL